MYLALKFIKMLKRWKESLSDFSYVNHWRFVNGVHLNFVGFLYLIDVDSIFYAFRRIAFAHNYVFARFSTQFISAALHQTVDNLF